jgi:hypothetical protein
MAKMYYQEYKLKGLTIAISNWYSLNKICQSVTYEILRLKAKSKSLTVLPIDTSTPAEGTKYRTIPQKNTFAVEVVSVTFPTLSGYSYTSLQETNINVKFEFEIKNIFLSDFR